MYERISTGCLQLVNTSFALNTLLAVSLLTLYLIATCAGLTGPFVALQPGTARRR